MHANALKHQKHFLAISHITQYIIRRNKKEKIKYTVMDKDGIALREVTNDGQSIFLYYDSMTGLYTAYGLSAYYTTLVTEPNMSYSDEMQMPVVILDRRHILCLRQSLEMVEHKLKDYYRFKLINAVGEEGYAKWASKLRQEYMSVE